MEIKKELTRTKNSYIKYMILYLLLILIFAFFYYLTIEIKMDKNIFRGIEVIESLYFSVVTITTLGYGDISPRNGLGMFLAGAEAILGIIVVGLFLNALWQNFMKNVEVKQIEAIDNKTSSQNIHKLITYNRYLTQVITDFKCSCTEVTSPLSTRKMPLIYNKKNKFSDMQDLYEKSIINKYSDTKPVIHIYYEKLDILIIELKYILSNFDLIEYNTIHETIVNFLTWSYSRDHRELLFSYENMSSDKESKKDIFVEEIKKNEKVPKLENGSNNILYPATLLDVTLKYQMVQIETLEHEFKELQKTKI